jgi:hypothetical protein
MADSFNVTNSATGIQVFLVDNSGNVTAMGSLSVVGVGQFTATATSGSTVLAPTFANGTAAQLTDLTRDYVIYLACTTSGTATTIAIGPTSAAANIIYPSLSITAGESFTVRLPAGWWLKWAGTSTAFATQTAVSC